MNKKDLIDLVKKNTSLTEVESTRLVTEMLEIIVKQLINKEKVDLRGFGTFFVAKRASRKGRNLNTGEVVEIPACNKVSFRVSKVLKQKLKLTNILT